MIWFYHSELSEKTIELSSEESRHCARVLRLKTGDNIAITDGNGHLAAGTILQVDTRQTVVNIENIETRTTERPFHLHMAVAPTKNIDRFEWFLEKATETGIDEITPVLCSQSERSVIKPERLHKILVAALKQSQRTNLPQLNPMVKFTDFISQKTMATHKFIAHCDEGEKSFLHQTYQKGESALVMIGPEGDFSGDEIRHAMQIRFKAISLGDFRLRTETAALNACVELNLLNRIS